MPNSVVAYGSALILFGLLSSQTTTEQPVAVGNAVEQVSSSRGERVVPAIQATNLAGTQNPVHTASTDGTSLPAAPFFVQHTPPSPTPQAPAANGTQAVKGPYKYPKAEAAEATIFPKPGKAVGYVRATEPGKWIVLASTLLPVKPEVVNEGKGCIFEGDAGTYAVIRIPKGDDDQPDVYTVTLGGIPAPPGPTPPGPQPPGPQPPGPQPPTPVFTGFAKLAYDEGMKVVQASRVHAPALADNFEAAGAKLAAGGGTIQQALTDITTRNRTILADPTHNANWRPWFTTWAAKAGAELKTTEDHVKAFNDTALGLRSVK